MKDESQTVHQVVLQYFDGDHDHGTWESPLFFRREDAEAFKAALCALPEDDARCWRTCVGMSGIGAEDAWIVSRAVESVWDGNIPSRNACLHVTYT